jgi:urease accessory protein UreH/urease accessory protein UreF
MPVQLVVERRDSDGVVIGARVFSSYPLKLHLLPHAPDAQPGRPLWAYVVSYGGGVVSGDELEMHFEVKPAASLVVTTQSTTKIFKQVGDRPASRSLTRAVVGAGGLLVLVPQPSTCFAHARCVQSTHVQLCCADSSSLCLVDWWTAGRGTAHDGQHNFAEFESTVTVSVGPTLVFRDAMRLNGQNGALSEHMRGFRLVGIVLLVGPAVSHVAQRLLTLFGTRDSSEGMFSSTRGAADSAGPLSSRPFAAEHDGGVLVSCCVSVAKGSVVLRIASGSMQQAAAFLAEHLGTLGGALHQNPFEDMLGCSLGASSPSHARHPPAELSPAAKRARYTDHSTEGASPLGLLRTGAEAAAASTCDMGSEANAAPVAARGQHADKAALDFVVWQLTDATLPTGGFAHSNGLEATKQLGFIGGGGADGEGRLAAHVLVSLVQASTLTLPFVAAAHRLMPETPESLSQGQAGPTALLTDDVLRQWAGLEALHNAGITAAVGRRASTAQGNALLRIVSAAFDDVAPTVQQLQRVVASGSVDGTAGHAATVHGAVCKLLGIGEADAVRTFAFTLLRDMLSAAVRLNLIGPQRAARAQAVLASQLDRLCVLARSLDAREAHQVAPLLEIWAAAHDRLYSRLFNS